MNCEETQKAFSLYVDDALGATARSGVDAHLEVCPVCRVQLNEMRAVVRGLSALPRPVVPTTLAASISDVLMVERAARATKATRPLDVRIARWLEPYLMPYAVGALASLILFVAVVGALRSPLGLLRDLAYADTNFVGGYDVTQPLTPENFAADRAPFAIESPSLNPRGALAQLAWTPSSGLPGDDDMIVVADVYGNGRASLAAVMEPPRNRRAVEEFEDALRKNPAFVPASLDRRPQTMRVVFVLQKMNVEERSY
ncbi:MAG TPA: zf-HC2 domain-containing protein [Pyrinomonadaceae bacterium]|jgi:hypothetical protein